MSTVTYTPWNANKRKNFFSYLPAEAQPGPTEPLSQEFSSSSYEAHRNAFHPKIKKWIAMKLGEEPNAYKNMNYAKMHNLLMKARRKDKEEAPEDPQPLQEGGKRKTRKQRKSRKSRKGTRRA